MLKILGMGSHAKAKNGRTTAFMEPDCEQSLSHARTGLRVTNLSSALPPSTQYSLPVRALTRTFTTSRRMLSPSQAHMLFKKKSSISCHGWSQKVHICARRARSCCSTMGSQPGAVNAVCANQRSRRRWLSLSTAPPRQGAGGDSHNCSPVDSTLVFSRQCIASRQRTCECRPRPLCREHTTLYNRIVYKEHTLADDYLKHDHVL